MLHCCISYELQNSLADSFTVGGGSSVCNTNYRRRHLILVILTENPLKMNEIREFVLGGGGWGGVDYIFPLHP